MNYSLFLIYFKTKYYYTSQIDTEYLAVINTSKAFCILTAKPIILPLFVKTSRQNEATRHKGSHDLKGLYNYFCIKKTVHENFFI